MPLIAVKQEKFVWPEPKEHQCIVMHVTDSKWKHGKKLGIDAVSNLPRLSYNETKDELTARFLEVKPGLFIVNMNGCFEGDKLNYSKFNYCSKIICSRALRWSSDVYLLLNFSNNAHIQKSLYQVAYDTEHNDHYGRMISKLDGKPPVIRFILYK